MKFIVDRKTWYRGQGGITSRLLNFEGQRCCIGFVAQQCGVPDEACRDIVSVDGIRKLITSRAAWPAWFIGDFGRDTKDLGQAYRINDDKDITDEARESALEELFASHGDTMEFVGERAAEERKR